MLEFLTAVLVQRGLAKDESDARRKIVMGKIRVDGEQATDVLAKIEKSQVTLTVIDSPGSDDRDYLIDIAGGDPSLTAKNRETVEAHAEAMSRLDPLYTAERMTDGDKEDAVGLGLLLHMSLSKKKEEAFKALQDTYFNGRFVEAASVYTALGFERLLSDQHGDKGDLFEVWFDRKRGLLLTAESYDRARLGDEKASVNMATVYYNWKPNAKTNAYPPRGSGGFEPSAGKTRYECPFEELTWAGSFDCREGLRLHLDWLEKHGQFVVPWVAQPHLWLIDYTESHASTEQNMGWPASGHYFKSVTEGRIARLPADVQRVIVGNSTLPA